MQQHTLALTAAYKRYRTMPDGGHPRAFGVIAPFTLKLVRAAARQASGGLSGLRPEQTG